MRTAMIILLILVSMVVLILVIGMTLPEKHVASTRTSFRAQPAQIWSAITDVKAFPDWRSDVKSVEMLPAVNGKPAWREDGSNGKISYVQEDARAPSRLSVRLTDDSLPFGGTWTYEIVPAANGSQLTITENGIVRNPVFRFVSRFVFGHHRTQETYLRDLGKKLNEAVTPVRL